MKRGGKERRGVGDNYSGKERNGGGGWRHQTNALSFPPTRNRSSHQKKQTGDGRVHAQQRAQLESEKLGKRKNRLGAGHLGCEGKTGEDLQPPGDETWGIPQKGGSGVQTSKLAGPKGGG